MNVLMDLISGDLSIYRFVGSYIFSLAALQHILAPFLLFAGSTWPFIRAVETLRFLTVVAECFRRFLGPFNFEAAFHFVAFGCF